MTGRVRIECDGVPDWSQEVFGVINIPEGEIQCYQFLGQGLLAEGPYWVLGLDDDEGCELYSVLETEDVLAPPASLDGRMVAYILCLNDELALIGNAFLLGT